MKELNTKRYPSYVDLKTLYELGHKFWKLPITVSDEDRSKALDDFLSYTHEMTKDCVFRIKFNDTDYTAIAVVVYKTVDNFETYIKILEQLDMYHELGCATSSEPSCATSSADNEDETAIPLF